MRSNREQCTEDIAALLLVGGLGTRLRSVVPSAPKPLASIGGKSFLELLVRQLRYQGIRRVVMCTGYLSDQIEQEFGDGRLLNVKIEYSRELQSLGTAGAVRLARAFVEETSDFIVMNGDSFLEIDFQQFVQFHREHGGMVSMAVLQVSNASRFGTVRMDSIGRVISFSEKARVESPGFINAGVYVFNRALLEHIPEGHVSLERDVFPRILRHGVYAVEQHGMFIDIGTPEDYARAQQLSDRFHKTAF